MFWHFSTVQAVRLSEVVEATSTAGFFTATLDFLAFLGIFPPFGWLALSLLTVEKIRFRKLQAVISTTLNLLELDMQSGEQDENRFRR